MECYSYRTTHTRHRIFAYFALLSSSMLFCVLLGYSTAVLASLRAATTTTTTLGIKSTLLSEVLMGREISGKGRVDLLYPSLFAFFCGTALLLARPQMSCMSAQSSPVAPAFEWLAAPLHSIPCVWNTSPPLSLCVGATICLCRS